MANDLSCPECGEPVPARGLKAPCGACLNRRWMRVILEREREYWTDNVTAKVDLARGKHGVLRHIALKEEPTHAYCSLPVSEPIKKRLRVFTDNLPSEICTDCRKAFEHIQEMAARTRAAKGVPT